MTHPDKQDCTASFPDPNNTCSTWVGSRHHCEREPEGHGGKCRCDCGFEWTVHG